MDKQRHEEDKIEYVVVASDDTGNVHCFGVFDATHVASGWARENVPWPGWMVRRVKSTEELEC